MNGLERAYDFHEVVNTANTLNHISAVEYGNNGLVFQKQHNKMENVWESLHKLTLGEQRPNLGDYSLIAGNADVVSALQEGLKEAQSMLRSLNMALSAQCQSRRKIWFDRPWLAEREDRQCFHYKPSARPTSGEDGDSEVLRDRLVSELSAAEPPAHAPQMRDNLEEFAAEEDESEHLRIIEEEARDAVTDVLNSAEVQVQQPQGSERIEATVEADGHVIYKSTLVSQLNGSVFLSKDRLARIKHSAQFNNHDNCLQASSSSGSGLLSIGSDCAVHFVQRSTTRLSSTVRSAAKRKRGPPSNPSRLTPTNCLRAVDEGVCWLGRVQAMRRRNGKQFGVLRQPMDLLARLEDRGRRTNQNPHIEVMLQYYRKYVGRDKFKYDHTDSKWIDIDCVICNVTLAYNPQNEVYSLDRDDAEHLRQFLADHSAR